MAVILKDFQETVCNGIVERFRNVALLYTQLATANEAQWQAVRKRDGAVVLQAPTGSGKTFLAVEAIARFSSSQPVLWFWFAPFSGLVEQAVAAIRKQAPQLPLLDLQSDRRLDAVLSGGVFVTTWASLAARSAESRKARVTGDTGLSIDALIAQARSEGVRIGCVVDEAHHGFHRSTQARAFFTDALKPDFTLMMTATPRDADARSFEEDTGYRIGNPADWASVSRYDGVAAGLLKRGVRTVRFLAKDGDDSKLIDFEHLAIDECVTTHQQIGKLLQDSGINLTPLMLVQVPDGKQAQADVQKYLVEKHGFPASAVRIHTADEPDPDLIALANDPAVEVLIFKMAVALGFDAPRAFTLAALRGARDANFGIQVIGRIVRVHSLLQGKSNLPEALNYGYVFLANAESQEGLLNAGEQINALTTQAPEIGTQTVITVIGNREQVQVARTGESFSLLVDPKGERLVDGTGMAQGTVVADDPVWGDSLTVTRHMFDLSGSSNTNRASGATPGTTSAALILSAQDTPYRYKRKDNIPPQLVTEILPPPPADIEARLADFVDFSDEVLACRSKVRASVKRTELDLFSGTGVTQSDRDIWANLSPEAVASKAEQLVLGIGEANPRELAGALLAKFRAAILNSGAVPPDDEEALMQELDLVLVRNPKLLATAFRLVRYTQIQQATIALPGELSSDIRLEPARRNIFGVFPPDLGENDERTIARRLDDDPLVRWWHRNSPHPRNHAIGLYSWDEGEGFFPDFIVSIEGRNTPEHLALLEVKGPHIWGMPKEVMKGAARHPLYGDAYMVGRLRDTMEFKYLRPMNTRLEPEAGFDIARMKWAN